MLAPGYKKSNIELTQKEKRRYERRIIKWVKQYLKDYYRQIKSNPDDEFCKTNRSRSSPIVYSPLIVWEEVKQQYLSKQRNATRKFTYNYYPSEIMAMTIYTEYEQLGISEREVYKDFLYVKECHINKIAARGFRKRPSWWKPKGRKD